MRLLCWNCRGLGSPEAVRGLVSLVRKLEPSVVFLSETRLFNFNFERLKLSLEITGCFHVKSSPTCSGLILFWNNNMTMDLLSYSDRHIDSTVTSSDDCFRFTGIYGYAETSMKYKTWELIDSLRNNSPLPWLIGGDLNDILSDSKKQGGCRRPQSQITNFRDCLARNMIFDCKPCSGWFTWSRTGPNVTPVCERLDRYLACAAWLNAHLTFQCRNVFSPDSDHYAIILDTERATPREDRAQHDGDHFRFESCWAKDPSCINAFHQAWSNASGTLLDKLTIVGNHLHDWQTTRRFNSNNRIAELQRKINSYMRRRQLSPDMLLNLRDVKLELRRLLDAKEAYWAQRSRFTWLSQGDKNTSFFHARASKRRKKNTIRGLFDVDQTWYTEKTELLQIASDYFQGLFTSSSPTSSPLLLEHISPVVNAEMNDSLLRPFTEDEVITAFRDIGPRKAPGFDGFPSSFYRQYWDVIGPEFVQLCLRLLRGEEDMETVNKAIIVLIPKVPDASNMRQFRPISLCTVIYKNQRQGSCESTQTYLTILYQ
ncbi:hypothetical protein HRI_002261200 [Hibiscus trionum]|uniref:Endonuclease/exonuclease/phosphatase domain-containing protein n=1 Tax=Hibiscus trionum TaxID=183268 RepID=A0A9W7HWW8_HIBTR|nr:hypothetical protein HRI_002261200 [Hibiscus trionum]